MTKADKIHSKTDPNYIIPDIQELWQIEDKTRTSGLIILRGKTSKRVHHFDAREGYALQYFTGEYTAQQIWQRCQLQLGFIPRDFVTRLLDKLENLGILSEEKNPVSHPQPLAENTLTDNTSPRNQLSAPKPLPQPQETPETQELRDRASPQKKYSPNLKEIVEWIAHPDGYWIMRNPKDITCLQVEDFDKQIICQLGKQPIPAIVNHYDITIDELQSLLKMLAATGMLEGTEPPKPPKGQISLMQLLSLKIPLINPDRWLTKHIDKIRWIWTWQFGFFLLAFFTTSVALWFAFSDEVVSTSKEIWTTGELITPITFILLSTLVVTCHEFGHALTLKHYGGIIPEIGLLLMLFIPGGYTNTTDQYSLVRRKERVLVVAAGIIVQLIIWAVAFVTLLLSKSIPWLHNSSYLLMTAAILTVIFNLNPLNKFDGYYLLVALTGINKLRDRSLQLYADFITREESLEEDHDKWILALYAPVSIAYTVWIFTSLFTFAKDSFLQYYPLLSHPF
jgi:hypothetical protein